MKVLVDYSWLHYRNKFAYNHLEVNKNGVIYRTGGLRGCFMFILSVLEGKIYHDEILEIYLCLDGIPLKQVREQSTYKADRVVEHDERFFDVPDMKIAQALTVFPEVKTAYHPEMEADETIAFLCETLDREPGEQIIIMSTDGDLRQLIDDERNILCSNNYAQAGGFAIETENIMFMSGPKDLRGLYPHAIALYKALVGDSGDNVKGIPRFSHDLARRLSNEFKTLDKLKVFLDNKTSVVHSRAYQVLRESWDLVSSNWLLVKLDPTEIPEIVDTHDIDIVEFLNYYEAYATLTQTQKRFQINA